MRNGDKLDVYITSLGAANSLKGGRLFVTPLQGPVPGSGIYGLAQGPVQLEDPSTPTVGRVAGGGVMDTDLPAFTVTNGHFTLIIEDPSASWATACASPGVPEKSKANARFARKPASSGLASMARRQNRLP